MRPGSAAASRLPGPPVSTAIALPDQTVPRASPSSSRSPLAEATPCASQRAGAKATAPASRPTAAPASAQRRLARRARSHACATKVESRPKLEGRARARRDQRRPGPIQAITRSLRG